MPEKILFFSTSDPGFMLLALLSWIVTCLVAGVICVWVVRLFRPEHPLAASYFWSVLINIMGMVSLMAFMPQIIDGTYASVILMTIMACGAITTVHYLVHSLG